MLQDDPVLEDLRNGPGGVGHRKTSESTIWRGFPQRFPAPSANQKITGSDLCFSIRSVLLVEEPTGDKLEERGVRGERRGSGFRSDRTVADFKILCISIRKQ